MKGDIRLTRTDQRPIAFFGEEVFSESTKRSHLSRWHVVRVFVVDGGFMVGIAHLTCYENERDNYIVDKAKTEKEVLELVKTIEPEVPKEGPIEDIAGLVTNLEHALDELHS